MHRAAYHFIKTLHIPSFTKKTRTLQAAEEENGDQPEEDNEDDNINMSNDIEASSDDVAAMASTALEIVRGTETPGVNGWGTARVWVGVRDLRPPHTLYPSTGVGVTPCWSLN